MRNTQKQHLNWLKKKTKKPTTQQSNILGWDHWEIQIGSGYC